jgi:Holliday junction resolvase RusA-like endonuclease
VTYQFFASGVPLTKGNLQAFCPRSREHNRPHATPCRPFVTEDTRSNRGKKVAAWQTTVKVASREVAPPQPLEGPVAVTLVFYLPQPKSRAKEPFPTFSRGDIDKLTRAVLDGLQQKTGGYIVVDDNQVTRLEAEVLWAGVRGPGVQVVVRNRDKRITWPMRERWQDALRAVLDESYEEARDIAEDALVELVAQRKDEVKL